ncbi:MAG TPA: hypothetical protein VGP26_10950 [Actinophytocola sp.]|jgi:hypothetical protein|nr:hypothetical protein [Actinophytocola sp.]
MFDLMVVFIVLGVVMIGPLLLELLERRFKIGGSSRRIGRTR